MPPLERALTQGLQRALGTPANPPFHKQSGVLHLDGHRAHPARLAAWASGRFFLSSSATTLPAVRVLEQRSNWSERAFAALQRLSTATSRATSHQPGAGLLLPAQPLPAGALHPSPCYSLFSGENRRNKVLSDCRGALARQD